MTTEQGSWWGKNWKWFVPVGCVGLIVMVVGMVAFISIVVLTGMKSTWAYTEGMALARQNPVLIEMLGEPMEAGILVVGSTNVSGSTGEANLAIPVSGPKGEGTLYIVARKVAGEWEMKIAEFQIAGEGLRIDLLETRDVTPVQVMLRGGDHAVAL